MAVGQEEADRLFHRRAARRFPRAGARPRRPVPHPDRAAPDRRARRGQAPGRGGPLRPPVLLLELAPRAAAGQPRARERSTPVAQSVADLRRVRAPAVLPPLRARLLRADAQAVPQGGESAAHHGGARARAGGGCVPRDRDPPGRWRRRARRGAREAEGRSLERGCLSSTSRPRSITRTASRTWGTRSRRSAPTASRVITGCAPTTSTS